MIKRVGMIGVGRLGRPCAEVLADHFEVEGFDPQLVTPTNFQMVESLAKVCAKKDVVFIAVPTPHKVEYSGETPSMPLAPQDFDYAAVRSILQSIGDYTTSDQIVVLISTVLPGTMRRELAPLAKRYKLIYNPYLVAMGSVKWDMVNPEMVIIGTEDGSENCDARRLIQLYESICQQNPRTVVGTWEEAECIKIFYNTFISMKISLVNMIQDVAERLHNMDVGVVTNALKESTQRITSAAYMTPGMGDGGACHPRDNIALRWLAKELDLGYDLFQAVVASREAQAFNLAARLVGLANEYDLGGIWIHGKAYKAFVDSTQGSYSLLIAHYVNALGREVNFVDPLTNDSRSSIHGVVLMAHAADVTYGHKMNVPAKLFYCDIEPGSVILDPWRRVRREDAPGCTVIHYGSTRLRQTKSDK